MIISFSTSVTGINTSLSKKFAWTIIDLSTEILLDSVLNYTEKNTHTHTHTHTHTPPNGKARRCICRYVDLVVLGLPKIC